MNNQLTSIEIPDSVTDIRYDAFANNPLENISLSTGITSIRENVFGDSFRNITRIKLGSMVNLQGDNDMAWRIFRTAYEANGGKAGVYTFRNSKWNWRRG